MGSEGQVWQTLQAHAEADDWSLVQRAVAGETLARRALLDRYLPLIYRVCIRSGLARADAQDVSQECVIKLLRFLPQYRGDAKLSTWIFTLTKRATADFFRAGARREHSVDWTDPVHDNLIHNSLSSQHHDRADELRDADRMTQWLAALAEPVRTIMMRFYLADETISEIAGEMRLPEGTVKTHLFRGRQLLRQRLEIQP